MAEGPSNPVSGRGDESVKLSLLRRGLTAARTADRGIRSFRHLLLMPSQRWGSKHCDVPCTGKVTEHTHRHGGSGPCT